MGWTVAAVATTIFLSLYESEDFRERMNMKISPDMTYRYKLIAIMFVDFAFCYIWEVRKSQIFPKNQLLKVDLMLNLALAITPMNVLKRSIRSV